MRPSFSERVERGRVLSGEYASRPGDDYGFFFLRTNAHVDLKVMVSSGSDLVPWQHVSVSARDRTPTWDEMCWVKNLFFEEEEAVVQFHPPKSAYINYHPYCLHLWRPNNFQLTLPPGMAVGPKTTEPLGVAP